MRIQQLTTMLLLLPSRVQLPWPFFALLFLCLTSCESAERVEGGQVVIRNDILDEQYNTFVVDQIMTASGLKGFRRTLKPGDELVLPFKDVHSLRFKRKYADHSKVYVVACPVDMDEKVTMRLINAHTGRFAGGCYTAKKGTIGRSGIVKWQS